MKMVILLVLSMILMKMADASHSSVQIELRHLLFNMVQDQQCHVEVSANEEQGLYLVEDLVTRIPITVKNRASKLNYKFNVCVLHIIILSSTDDVDLITYNRKERL